jgi:DNA-binding HxlR family transcriptional regulator
MVDLADLPSHMKACPIEVALTAIGKKWAINIIRDLFLGHRHFSGFLRSNKGLSKKMLAARLRQLERDELVYKSTTKSFPPKTAYYLTKKGEALRNILLEMAIFSFRYCPQEVYKENKPKSIRQDILLMKKLLKIKK